MESENHTWDSFFVSIPQLAGASNPGGVSEISTAGTGRCKPSISEPCRHLIVLADRTRRWRERQHAGWLRQRGDAGDPAR